MKKICPWPRMAATTLMTACLSVFSWPLSTPAAPASFQQAVADYNSGKYTLALSELDGYKAMYPTNALVHYYSALCHQALNHLDQAKTDYQYVAEHGDARLQSMSRTAIDQLSRVHSQMSFSGASAAPAVSSSAPRMVANSLAQGKVKRILEFSADW
jgi:tetratricopeptide (TPR) repeat protein